VKKVMALVFLMLSGCATTAGQIPLVTKLETDINKAAQTVLTPDFTNALAMSTAAGAANHSTCWSGLLATLNSLPTTTPGSTVPSNMVGFASGAELLAELQQNPPTLPTFIELPPAVHDACAGIILSDEEILGKFGMGIGMLSTPGAVAALKATALAPIK
jgi:hypothetical protein